MHQHKPPACQRTFQASLINADEGKTRSSQRRALHKQDSNKYTPNSTRTASDQRVCLTSAPFAAILTSVLKRLPKPLESRQSLAGA